MGADHHVIGGILLTVLTPPSVSRELFPQDFILSSATLMTASLTLTGRKIREQELALAFSDTGKWSMMGDAAEVRRSDFEREALQVLQEHGPLTPGDYAHLTGRKRATVTVQLGRMVSKNLITKHDGRYAVILFSPSALSWSHSMDLR